MGDRKDSSGWEEYYRGQDVETMPWYSAGLDADFEAALDEHGIGGGKLLDLCTGPGTQAMALAGLGFEVHATDISATAIRKAHAKAAASGRPVTFRQADILRDDLGSDFDVVIDRGCFHVFEPDQRDVFVAAVAVALRPAGWLLLKCFSTREKRKEGPYRFTPKQLRGYFGDAFEVVSIQDSVFSGTLDDLPKALFSVMRRKA